MLEDRTLDNGFILGLFRPADAPGIVACYREMYRDDFPMRYVYDPGAIAERNAQGKQYTVVVRDPEGRVAGLAGLFPIEGSPGVFEAGQLMVRKEYRRLRLAQALGAACFEELLPQVGAKVFMIEAVCDTDVSQKLATLFGMIPTGLELEVLPKKSGQTSLLSLFKVVEDKPQTLFIPKRYLDFIHASCKRLGLARDFDAGDEPREGQSAITSHLLEAANLVRCRVRRAGLDFAELLRAWLGENQGRILHVQVNLADPAAPWALDILREHGFFLGAHLPQWMESDALMLQRLPGEQRPERIIVVPGPAEDILVAVLADRKAVLGDQS